MAQRAADVKTALRKGPYDFILVNFRGAGSHAPKRAGGGRAAQRSGIGARRSVPLRRLSPSCRRLPQNDRADEVLQKVAASEASTILIQGESQNGQRFGRQSHSLPKLGQRKAVCGHQLFGDSGNAAKQQLHGNQIRAAKLPDISRDPLRYKMKNSGSCAAKKRNRRRRPLEGRLDASSGHGDVVGCRRSQNGSVCS
jgi:hypothetical protein